MEVERKSFAYQALTARISVAELCRQAFGGDLKLRDIELHMGGTQRIWEVADSTVLVLSAVADLES